LILLDAYALVALLADEVAADEVEQLLRTGDASVGVVNLSEALEVAQRVHRLGAEELQAAIDPLLDQHLPVLGVSTCQAWRAAELRSRYYDRKTCALSLADCLLLAMAQAGDRIATSDPPLARAARAEGVAVVGLPDSTGREP
jgi:predicted nucleic acid-binding protein